MSINPGLIETKMTEGLQGKKESPEVIAKIATYLALPENKISLRDDHKAAAIG